MRDQVPDRISVVYAVVTFYRQPGGSDWLTCRLQKKMRLLQSALRFRALVSFMSPASLINGCWWLCCIPLATAMPHTPTRRPLPFHAKKSYSPSVQWYQCYQLKHRFVSMQVLISATRSASIVPVGGETRLAKPTDMAMAYSDEHTMPLLPVFCVLSSWRSFYTDKDGHVSVIGRTIFGGI